MRASQLGINSNTWINENMTTLEANPHLMRHLTMKPLKQTPTTVTTQSINLEYNNDNNSIDLAFRHAERGYNVYLTVYGDHRYPGGGVTMLTKKIGNLPRTQEEQIFVRTTVAKIFYGNEKFIFNKDNNSAFAEAKSYIEDHKGYTFNPKRHFFFTQHMMKKLMHGHAYLIRNIYLIRDQAGNSIAPSASINLIYAAAPMYQKKLTNGKNPDEKPDGTLGSSGLKKIKQYQRTIRNIFHATLPTTSNNMLLFGGFGMGVYVSNPRHEFMGLFKIENAEYVKKKYLEYIKKELNGYTSYSNVINVLPRDLLTTFG